MTSNSNAPYRSALLGLQGLQYKDTGFDDRTSPSCPRARAQTSLLRYRLTHMGTLPGKQVATVPESPRALQALPEVLLPVTRGPGPSLGISGMTARQTDSNQKPTSGKPRGRLSQEVNARGEARCVHPQRWPSPAPASCGDSFLFLR